MNVSELHSDLIVYRPAAAPRAPTAIITEWLTLGDATWISRLERAGTSPRLLRWLRNNWPPEAPIPGRLLLAVRNLNGAGV